MQDDLINYENGIRFECQGSGKCCVSRDSYGFVYLSNIDLKRFSKYFKLSLKAFKKKYCQITDGFIHLAEKDELKGNCIFLKDKREESDFNHTLSLIKQYEIIKECYQKANHYINLASNSLSIFKDCNERNILENLTSFSLSRDF